MTHLLVTTECRNQLYEKTRHRKHDGHGAGCMQLVNEAMHVNTLKLTPPKQSAQIDINYSNSLYRSNNSLKRSLRLLQEACTNERWFLCMHWSVHVVISLYVLHIVCV